MCVFHEPFSHTRTLGLSIEKEAELTTRQSALEKKEREIKAMKDDMDAREKELKTREDEMSRVDDMLGDKVQPTHTFIHVYVYLTYVHVCVCVSWVRSKKSRRKNLSWKSCKSVWMTVRENWMSAMFSLKTHSRLRCVCFTHTASSPSSHSISLCVCVCVRIQRREFEEKRKELHQINEQVSSLMEQQRSVLRVMFSS